MLATLFASAGTPMLMAGDEMDRTQDGNNNAYCQDNEISYVDWERGDTDDARTLTDFTARLIALRQRYQPCVRRIIRVARRSFPASPTRTGSTSMVRSWSKPPGVNPKPEP